MEILARKVKSSMIEQVDYDTLMDKMIVKFRSGDIYEFYDVSKETYDEMLQAESVGKFFVNEVKNKFEYARRGEVQDIDEDNDSSRRNGDDHE